MMLEQLRETWDGLEQRQRIALVALAVMIIGGLVAVGTWSMRPTWAVLYARLAPEDAQAVVERLREQGVPHRLAAGGSAIEVPQERLYELRLALAGEGLPSSSSVGFELFDRASFSTSDLQNNVNLQRALQGELERSICTLDEISSARVHLALPEERLFSDVQEQPSASVVVSLGSSRPTSAQVGAITQLVASAVPGLAPTAITVVDTTGRMLSGGPEGSGGLQTMAQFEATRAYEENLRAHLQSMLDSVVGATRSVVRVQAELDFQSLQLTRETLDPPDGEGVVRREETVHEQYTGSAGGEVGGPAGLVAMQTQARGDGGSYEHRKESREYDYSRVQEQVSSPPGQVRRLTVAVVIDQSLSGDAARQVRQVVTAAAGIDQQRGDSITVESMAIDAVKVAEEETKLAEAAEASRARAESMHRAFRYGGMILMAAMIAGAMLMVSRRLGPTEQPDQRDEPSTSAEDDVAQETDGREEPLSPDTLEFAPMDVAQLAERTMTDTPLPVEEVVVESLAELGSRAPEEFARHLRGWINAATARDNSGDESD